MKLFHSLHLPHLRHYIADEERPGRSVKFVDGEYSTDDPVEIATLEASDHVVAAGDAPKPKKDPEPPAPAPEPEPEVTEQPAEPVVDGDKESPAEKQPRKAPEPTAKKQPRKAPGPKKTAKKAAKPRTKRA